MRWAAVACGGVAAPWRRWGGVAASALLGLWLLASPAIGQAPGADRRQALHDERATYVQLLNLPGVLFAPTVLGIVVPVSREPLQASLLIRRIENPGFDPESALRDLLRFDRAYRAQLQSQVAAIDALLGTATAPAPAPAPVTPPAPSPPLLGVDPTSRPSFDRYLDEQRAGGARDGEQALVVTPTSATLFGRPLCSYTVELIITAGREQTDRTPGSPSFGQRMLMVPAAEEAGFQVQLFHPDAGVVRLAGRAARIALERKGYLVATGQGWRGTAMYDDFVNHGAGYRRQAVACAAAGELSATALAVVVENKVNRGKVEVRFTIHNPLGIDVRLERGRRTHWVPQNDGSGRFVGGSMTTDDPGRALTVNPGTHELKRNAWLPCSGGRCSGTYQEDWEGHDASGQPRRLRLLFSGVAR